MRMMLSLKKIKFWMPIVLVALFGGLVFKILLPVSAQGVSTHAYLPLVGKKMTLGFGSLKGKVTSATTNAAIAKARVCVSGTTCTETDPLGNYTFGELSMGAYPISATAELYDTRSTSTFVNGRQENQFNLTLSPQIGGGGDSKVMLRVILTWSANPTWPDGSPNDLDLHMWLDVPNPPTHLYNSNRGECTMFPNACLITDMTWGSGPETIDITHIENAVYTVGVLNFNQTTQRPKVPGISAAAAHISLHDLRGEFYSIDVPTSGSGDFWLAFRMVGNSTDNSYRVEPINCITWDPGDAVPTCQATKAGFQARPTMK